MPRFWSRAREKANSERADAARTLRDVLELGPYVDELSIRCSDELATNNFGDAIRVAMRRRPV